MSRKSLFFSDEWFSVLGPEVNQTLLVISYIFMLVYGVVWCMCVYKCACVYLLLEGRKKASGILSVTRHLIPLRQGLSEPRVQFQWNCQLAKAQQLFFLSTLQWCWETDVGSGIWTPDPRHAQQVFIPAEPSVYPPHKVVPSLMLLLIKDSSFVVINGAQYFCAGNRTRALCVC